MPYEIMCESTARFAKEPLNILRSWLHLSLDSQVRLGLGFTRLLFCS